MKETSEGVRVHMKGVRWRNLSPVYAGILIRFTIRHVNAFNPDWNFGFANSHSIGRLESGLESPCKWGSNDTRGRGQGSSEGVRVHMKGVRWRNQGHSFGEEGMQLP